MEQNADPCAPKDIFVCPSLERVPAWIASKTKPARELLIAALVAKEKETRYFGPELLALFWEWGRGHPAEALSFATRMESAGAEHLGEGACLVAFHALLGALEGGAAKGFPVWPVLNPYCPNAGPSWGLTMSAGANGSQKEVKLSGFAWELGIQWQGECSRFAPAQRQCESLNRTRGYFVFASQHMEFEDSKPGGELGREFFKRTCGRLANGSVMSLAKEIMDKTHWAAVWQCMDESMASAQLAMECSKVGAPGKNSRI